MGTGPDYRHRRGAGPAASVRGFVPASGLSVRTESDAEIADHLGGATGGPLFSARGTLGLGCVTPDAYELSFWTAGRRWMAEVEIDSLGAAEEPVLVRGRPVGL